MSNQIYQARIYQREARSRLLNSRSTFTIYVSHRQTGCIQSVNTISIDAEHRRVASTLMENIDPTVPTEVMSGYPAIPAIFRQRVSSPSNLKFFLIDRQHLGSAFGTQGAVTDDQLRQVSVEFESDSLTVASPGVFHGRFLKGLSALRHFDFISVLKTPLLVGNGMKLTWSSSNDRNHPPNAANDSEILEPAR